MMATLTAAKFLRNFFVGCFFTTIVLSNINAQTPGSIFATASGAGDLVLDPNGDGFISQTTAGFSANDIAESELPFVPMVFLQSEGSADNLTGPNCGFTDFVDNGAESPALVYYDNTNLLFRFRLGNALPNAKGYSVLIDTDQRMGYTGPNADPNATNSNPGFEIEISLQTNGGVFVYNVDGICPGTATLSYPGTTNYQKSFALGNTCGTPDYFYDFFVNVSDLAVFGINTSTPLRLASTTVMNPNPALCNQAVADLAGVDNNTCTVVANCLVDLIDNYFPTSIDNLNVGTPLDRSACPTITSQVKVGNTSISGTSGEANGTVIKVFYNGGFVQSAVVTGGVWTCNPLVSALVVGNTVTVSATAPGKTESFTNCSAKLVAENCTAPLVIANTTECAPKKGFTGIAGSAIPGAIIRVYNSNNVLQTPDAGSIFSAGSITANADGSWLWKCNGSSNACAGANNCLSDGTYYLTQQSGTLCESAPIFICVGTGLRLQEVGDFGDENCLPPQNLIRST